jgi:hypothetical protein
MTDRPVGIIKSFVRREWWIVLLAVVASVAIALAGGQARPPSYQAVATVVVNRPVLATSPALLYGDRLLSEVSSAEFYEFAAEQSGIDAGEISSRLRTAATGKLQDNVSVQYSSADEGEAETGADESAKAVVAYAKRYGSTEIDRLKQIIAQSDTALARIEELQASIEGSPYEQADIEAQRLKLEQEATTNRAALQQIEQAYRYSGDVRVSLRTGSRRVDMLAAAVLAGLVVGIAIGAVREYFLIRREG